MRIESLPNAAEEIRSLFKIFTEVTPSLGETILRHSETVCYLGESITKKRVIEECKGYRFIHFATHGLLDDEYPLNSGLLLAHRNVGGNKYETEFIQGFDIFSMKLNADLVTLSACETGLGKLEQGEGLVGLTRAFIYAGTPSVIASLWSVADKHTMLFMKELYAHLKAGKEKHIALFLARKEVMREAKAPFYWAPFVLVGDWY